MSVTNPLARGNLPKVITAAEMRRNWLDGDVSLLSPILDMTVNAGHWWNLDGSDAWVRATDPKAIAIHEAQRLRSATILKQLRQKTQRLSQRKLLRGRAIRSSQATRSCLESTDHIVCPALLFGCAIKQDLVWTDPIVRDSRAAGTWTVVAMSVYLQLWLYAIS